MELFSENVVAQHNLIFLMAVYWDSPDILMVDLQDMAVLMAEGHL